ncbi:MAG: antibiotic biosynthesis monooxygenase [Proteobacteria bacterium]|nr:antibiotic biosynthesis monooxygenase [Pseudomonadota bacterium]
MAESSGPITLINVYTCQPERQEELLRVLRALTEEARRLPGFRSARLHRSLNGKHVVNYAEWDQMEQWRAMVRHPSVQAHMGRVVALATFQPHAYEPGEIYEPAS